MINTQDNPEYRSLIDKYEFGLHCHNGDVKDIANKIEQIYENPNLNMKFRKNHYKMAEDLFDRKQTYLKIVQVIDGHFKKRIN